MNDLLRNIHLFQIVSSKQEEAKMSTADGMRLLAHKRLISSSKPPQEQSTTSTRVDSSRVLTQEQSTTLARVRSSRVYPYEQSSSSARVSDTNALTVLNQGVVQTQENEPIKVHHKRKKRHRRDRPNHAHSHSDTLVVAVTLQDTRHTDPALKKDGCKQKNIKSILKKSSRDFVISDSRDNTYAYSPRRDKMESEDFSKFPQEVSQKHGVLYDKLKSLKIAVDEYIRSTRYKREDFRELGDLQQARTFRPVTPANVKVLYRLVAKDVKGLRIQFEKWQTLDLPEIIWGKQLDSKIAELEKMLHKLSEDLKRLKELEKEEARESARRTEPEPVPPPSPPSPALPPLVSPEPKEDTEEIPERPPPKDCSDCDDCKKKAKDKLLNPQNQPGMLKSSTFYKPPPKAIARSMSDSALMPYINRQSTFAGTQVNRLRKEKTILGPSSRGIFQKQVNVAYPFGSSFPELPPIWKLRRGSTFAIQPKKKEYWSST